jgi:hypothetical protein
MLCSHKETLCCEGWLSASGRDPECCSFSNGNGVMNMGIRLYNKVPNKIREVGKMRQFKRVFRSYLVQQLFYSVEEYMLR